MVIRLDTVQSQLNQCTRCLFACLQRVHSHIAKHFLVHGVYKCGPGNSETLLLLSHGAASKKSLSCSVRRMALALGGNTPSP